MASMTKAPEYALVYQCGIANVFRTEPLTRVLQQDYRGCEMFAAGLREAGKDVGVYHCDQAGDARNLDWEDGIGKLWADKKRPPIA
jgi:hypothetical protein